MIGTPGQKWKDLEFESVKKTKTTEVSRTITKKVFKKIPCCLEFSCLETISVLKLKKKKIPSILLPLPLLFFPFLCPYLKLFTDNLCNSLFAIFLDTKESCPHVWKMVLVQWEGNSVSIVDPKEVPDLPLLDVWPEVNHLLFLSFLSPSLKSRQWYLLYKILMRVV